MSGPGVIVPPQIRGRPRIARGGRRRLATAWAAFALGAASLLGLVATPASTAAQFDPATVAALELRGATTGIVLGIVHEGELALLDTYGAPTAERTAALDPEAVFAFPWGTQMLMGITARALAANGSLALDAPISAYLPELVDAPIGAATVGQLLEHRSGLPELIPPPGVGWSELLDQVGGLELVAPPGAVYSRSRLSYPLAARVLERVAGVPLNELLSTAVLTPLGLAHSTFSPVVAAESGQLMQGYREAQDTVRPVRHAFDASGLPVLYTSAPDLLTLAVTWMSDGLQGAPPLLPLRDDDPLLAGRRFADGMWMEPGGSPPRAWSNDEALGFGANLTLYPESRSAVLVAANGRLPSGLVSWGLSEVEVTLLGEGGAGGDAVAGPESGEGDAVPADASGDRARSDERFAPLPADLQDWVGTFANGRVRIELRLDDAGRPLVVQGENQVPLRRIEGDRWALEGPVGTLPVRLLRVAGDPVIASAGIVYRRTDGG